MTFKFAKEEDEREDHDRRRRTKRAKNVAIQRPPCYPLAIQRPPSWNSNKSQLPGNQRPRTYNCQLKPAKEGAGWVDITSV
jgi:hypothetical protein